jgi:hypothetical protein
MSSQRRGGRGPKQSQILRTRRIMNEISSVTILDMSKTYPHFWELVRKSHGVQHVGHHTISTQDVQRSRERESFRPEVLDFAGPCEGVVIP